MNFSPIPELLDEIRAGRMIIMLDDEDRENEGDLIMAASLVRPEDINFMATHARGLICLALSEARCKQLQLPPMVADNRARHRTAFTVSIEAAQGVSTGISAFDRAHTIRTAVHPDTVPADLHQPGHVFPLAAMPGGVLVRAGHTEASVDLARLAGLEPAGVLVEIMSTDGSMARRPELERYAVLHGLKMGTIAELIRYRMRIESTLQREYEQEVDTRHGRFQLVAWRDRYSHALHFSLSRGQWNAETIVPVRVHVDNVLSDVLQLTRDDFGISAERALAAIAEADCGVFVALGESADPEHWLARLRQDYRPATAADAWRTSGLGAQILAGLGVHRLRVIGTQRRYLGLSGFGLEVVDYAPPLVG
jgi:3,4-dihydroxy 2-butanone 4-phosphate synthase / GTP cyclohydrolase II